MTSILIIGWVWPEPSSSAAGSHMLSILRVFRSEGWSVTFASAAQTTEHMVDLRIDDIEVHSITLNNSSFDRFIAQQQPNLVMYDCFIMEEQYGWRVEKNCPQALRILDTGDLQCLREARWKAFKQDRALAQADWCSDIAKREIASIYRSDLSLIISEYEMELLTHTFNVPHSLLQHVPFMLDLPSLSSQHKPFEARKHFLTIGNFRHVPNWDSVLYLHTLWPHIRTQIHEAELHIYGAYPPAKAMRLHQPKDGFCVKGWADNAIDVMENARVCLAPLRFGAGLKGKLLDAMVAGTPSVTTPIGAEGMCRDLSWPGSITHTSEEFVTASVDLYQNHEHWQQAQGRIQPILETIFDQEMIGTNLMTRINQLRMDLDSHRQRNFTGAMLRHHTMKSTQYMSQWIESKTQLEALRQSSYPDPT